MTSERLEQLRGTHLVELRHDDLVELIKHIDSLEELVDAVNVNYDEGGALLHDVRGVNWFDARDAALS